MENTLALIRQKLGHGKIKPFIEKELKVKYRTFVYQCENGTVPYKTIILLMDKLGIKFEEFKQKQFTVEIKAAEKKVERKKEVKKIAEQEIHIPQPKKLSSIFGGN